MTGSTAAPSPQEVARNFAGRDGGLVPPFAVVACCVVFFWSLSIRSLIYTVMPTVSADLGLSASAVGIVIAALLCAYCFGSWIAGWMPGSRKSKILWGVGSSALGGVLYSLSPSYPMLLAAAPVVGLGVGLYLPLGLGILVDLGGKASYMVEHEVAASLGNFAGAMFVALALAWAGWHGSILAWCGVGALAFIAFTRVQDSPSSTAQRSTDQRVALGRTLVYSVVSYAATTILLVGLISVLPLILVKAWGLSQSEAASVVGYTRLASLLGVAFVGLTARRWGSTRTTVALQVVGLLGCVAMSLDGFSPLFVIGVIVVAAGASGSVTLLPLVIAGGFRPAQRDRAMAMSTGVGGFLGMAVAPAIFGALLDAGLPSGPMLLSAAGMLAAIPATLRIGRASTTG